MWDMLVPRPISMLIYLPMYLVNHFVHSSVIMYGL